MLKVFRTPEIPIANLPEELTSTRQFLGFLAEEITGRPANCTPAAMDLDGLTFSWMKLLSKMVAFGRSEIRYAMKKIGRCAHCCSCVGGNGTWHRLTLIFDRSSMLSFRALVSDMLKVYIRGNICRDVGVGHSFALQVPQQILARVLCISVICSEAEAKASTAATRTMHVIAAPHFPLCCTCCTAPRTSPGKGFARAHDADDGPVLQSVRQDFRRRPHDLIRTRLFGDVHGQVRQSGTYHYAPSELRHTTVSDVASGEICPTATPLFIFGVMNPLAVEVLVAIFRNRSRRGDHREDIAAHALNQEHQSCIFTIRFILHWLDDVGR